MFAAPSKKLPSSTSTSTNIKEIPNKPKQVIDTVITSSTTITQQGSEKKDDQQKPITSALNRGNANLEAQAELLRLEAEREQIAIDLERVESEKVSVKC